MSIATSPILWLFFLSGSLMNLDSGQGKGVLVLRFSNRPIAFGVHDGNTVLLSIVAFFCLAKGGRS